MSVTASMYRVLAFVGAAALLVAPPSRVSAQPALDFAVEVNPPRPEAFFILNRSPLPSVTVERLPAHLRAAWVRAREATDRVMARHRARMQAMRPFAERRRAADRAPAERQEALHRAISDERLRVAAQFEDIAELGRQEEHELRSALVLARRSHAEHGLGQLALAELELRCAALDFANAYEAYDQQLEAGHEGPEPPENPSFERVLPAADRAAARLRGRWRASALYLHAYASLELGDGAGANARLRTLFAMPDTPLHAEGALRLGEAAFQQGSWQEAAQYYHQALGEPRFQRIATYKLAWAELRAGRWAEARDAASELVAGQHEFGDEARRVLLPRALARISDHQGASLPSSMAPAHRAHVLVALSELLLRTGDTPASRDALDAAEGVGADAGLVASHRRLVDLPETDRRRLERWVRSTVWRCAPGTTLESFSASGRFSSSSAGYGEVVGGDAIRSCLEQNFGALPRRGASFRVDVRRRR